MNQNIVVYIAGPYRAGNAWEIQRNIMAAKEAALSVLQGGWVAICPHANTANMDGAAPDDVFLAAGLELLRRSDAVLVVNDWSESQGTRREILEANRYGIPVYFTFSELEDEVNCGMVKSRSRDLTPLSPVAAMVDTLEPDNAN